MSRGTHTLRLPPIWTLMKKLWPCYTGNAVLTMVALEIRFSCIVVLPGSMRVLSRIFVRESFGVGSPATQFYALGVSPPRRPGRLTPNRPRMNICDEILILAVGTTSTGGNFDAAYGAHRKHSET